MHADRPASQGGGGGSGHSGGWEGTPAGPPAATLALSGLFSMSQEPSLKGRVSSLPCSALNTPTSPRRRPGLFWRLPGPDSRPGPLPMCPSPPSLLLNPRVGPHYCLPLVQTTRHGPTAGPSSGPCPLPQIFSPQIPARLAPLSPRSLLRISRPRSHLDTEWEGGIKPLMLPG